VNDPDLFGYVAPLDSEELDMGALRSLGTSPKRAEKIAWWRIGWELACDARGHVDGRQSDVIGAHVVVYEGSFNHAERQALGMLSGLVPPPDGAAIPPDFFPTEEELAPEIARIWRMVENRAYRAIHCARRKGGNHG